MFDSSLIVAKDLSIGGNLSADSGEIHAISAYFSIVSVTDSLTVTRNISAGNDISATNNISAGNGITATNNISAGNGITATNNISAPSASFSNLTVSGVADLTAEHAKWSDLAEYYLADKKYEPGTLVHFSGQAELTVARKKANAVVTTNPAFLMNCAMRDMQSSCAIALAGRVPVRVVGKVKKFDKLVLSDVPGVARARKRIEFWKKPIGIALENSA